MTASNAALGAVPLDTVLVDQVRAALIRAAEDETLNWPAMVEKVRERTAAHDVIAVDDDGLAMEARGDATREWIDALAAHGRLMWDLAERLAPGYVRSISVQYPSRWVTTVGAPRVNGRSSLFVLAGRAPAESALGVPAFAEADRWSRFLRWCATPADSNAALAVDGEGLLVDLVGEIDRDGAEAIGAHLVLMAEAADRVGFLGGQARMFCVRFERRWLTGMRTPRTRNRTAMVGLIGTRPPGPGAVSDLKRALRALAAG